MKLKYKTKSELIEHINQLERLLTQKKNTEKGFLSLYLDGNALFSYPLEEIYDALNFSCRYKHKEDGSFEISDIIVHKSYLLDIIGNCKTQHILHKLKRFFK